MTKPEAADALQSQAERIAELERESETHAKAYGLAIVERDNLRHELKTAQEGWRCECSTDDACRFARERDALRAALANAEPTGWQPIETAPATANNVLAFSESGNMKIETGFWLLNMLNAANVDGEKCNYTHWMPLPAAPGDTP